MKCFKFETQVFIRQNECVEPMTTTVITSIMNPASDKKASADTGTADTSPKLDLGPAEIDAAEITLEAPIGDGSFGAVYRGRCRAKAVAVKVLYRQFAPGTLEAFRKEVAILRTVSHPNVALFMGASTTTPGKLMICSELLCTDLETLLQDRTQALPLLTRLRMAQDAALGLCWLHGANPAIVHRDVKPSNFLVDEHLRVKVCDFGLSQLVPRGTHLVDAGRRARGTPLWMSPEVLLGREFDAKADIYSYGLVLWQILTRQELFPEQSSLGAFVRAVTHDNLRPPLPARLAPDLAALLQACWDTDPARRPSAADIVARLDAAIHALAIPDPAARTWWSRAFASLDAISWQRFAAAYCAHCGLPVPLGPPSSKTEDTAVLTFVGDAECGDADDNNSHTKGVSNDEELQESELDLACLHALLVGATGADSDTVTMERFGSVVAWLGAWDTEGNARLGLGRRARELCQQPWFHGDLTVADACDRLVQQGPGTFLLRFSSSEPGSFTISRVDMRGTVRHHRIAPCTSNGTGMRFAIADTVCTSLPDLVHVMRAKLQLFVPCPGSPFAHLFVPAASFDYES